MAPLASPVHTLVAVQTMHVVAGALPALTAVRSTERLRASYTRTAPCASATQTRGGATCCAASTRTGPSKSSMHETCSKPAASEPDHTCTTPSSPPDHTPAPSNEAASPVYSRPDGGMGAATARTAPVCARSVRSATSDNVHARTRKSPPHVKTASAPSCEPHTDTPHMETPHA
jgi:hypothetical protein